MRREEEEAVRAKSLAAFEGGVLAAALELQVHTTFKSCSFE